MLSGLFARAVGMVAAILIARKLGLKSYGELGIVQSTVMMFGSFANMSMTVIAVKYIAELRENDKDRAGRIAALTVTFSLVTGVLFAGAIAAFADLIAAKTLKAAELVPLMQIAAIGIVFDTLNGTQRGILVGLESFKPIAMRSAISGLIAPPMMLIGALYWGVAGTIIGQVASNVVNWVLFQYSVRREVAKAGIRFDWKGMKRETSVIWNFSLPRFLSRMMSEPAKWGSTAMLVRHEGGLEQMGLYNAASKFRSFILMIPGYLSDVSTTMLAERIGTKDLAGIKKVIRMGMLSNAAAALPIGLLMCILSPWIMRQFGEGFEPGWPVLVIVAASASIRPLIQPHSNLITASGKVWQATLLDPIYIAALLGSMLYFRSLGAVGLALAYLIADITWIGYNLTFSAFLLRRFRSEFAVG